MALPDDFQTLLVISTMGVPLYSARGLEQTYETIDAAKNMQRTVNGELFNASPDQFMKYSTKISCTDQNTPALDGIMPGMQLTIECVFEFAYKTGVGTPSRAVVPYSERTEGDHTFYRPVLTIVVTDFNTGLDEWDRDYKWELEGEEV